MNRLVELRRARTQREQGSVQMFLQGLLAFGMLLALAFGARSARASIVDENYGYYHECSYLVHAENYGWPYGVYTYNHAPCANYCNYFWGWVYNWGYYWSDYLGQWVSTNGGGWSCTGFKSTDSLNNSDTVISYGQIQRPPGSYSPMVTASASIY